MISPSQLTTPKQPSPPLSRARQKILIVLIVFVVLFLLLLSNLIITSQIIKKNETTSTLSSQELSVVKLDYHYGIFGCVMYGIMILVCLSYYFRDDDSNMEFIGTMVFLTGIVNMIVPAAIAGANWNNVSYNTIFDKTKTLVGSGDAWYAYVYNGILCFIVALAAIILLFMACTQSTCWMIFLSMNR